MKDEFFTIDRLKETLTPEEILSGSFGVEREGLRAYANGQLSLTPHPAAFGNKLTNPYITTDFSESQVEIVTPPCPSTREAYRVLATLTDMVNTVLPSDEYLWPNSVPCVLPADPKVPIAHYSGAPGAEKAMRYRQNLAKKYGAKKQMFSGIHFNYSLGLDAVEKLYQRAKKDDETLTGQHFKNQLYLKIAKNYLTYRWFLIYMTGASVAAHHSFIEECLKLMPWSDDRGSQYSQKGISFRSGSPGYKNNEALYPRYDTIQHFIADLETFVAQGKLSEPKEFYAQARLKPVHPKEDWIQSLAEEGVMYIELRTMDLNPFDPYGISETDMNIMHLLLLYCMTAALFSEDSDQAEADDNAGRIAEHGQDRFLILHRGGKEILARDWAKAIVADIAAMNHALHLGQDEIVAVMNERVDTLQALHAAQMVHLVEDEGYVAGMSRLAQAYKKQSWQKVKNHAEAFEKELVRFKDAVPSL